MTRAQRGGARARSRLGGRLARRSAADWAKLIAERVETAWQAGVASVVWWDFADVAPDRRAFTERFEYWLVAAAGREVPGSVLLPALLRLGYPSVVAEWRAAERRTVSMPRPRGRPPAKRPWPVGAEYGDAEREVRAL